MFKKGKTGEAVKDTVALTRNLVGRVLGEREEEYLDIPSGHSGEDTWDRLADTYGESTVEEAASTDNEIDQFAFAYHPDSDFHYILALNPNLNSMEAMKALITNKVEETRVGVIRNPRLDPDLLAARLETVMDSDDNSDFYAAIDRQIDRAKEGLPLEKVVIQAIEAKGFDIATELAHEGEDYDSLPRI